MEGVLFVAFAVSLLAIVVNALLDGRHRALLERLRVAAEADPALSAAYRAAVDALRGAGYDPETADREALEILAEVMAVEAERRARVREFAELREWAKELGEEHLLPRIDAAERECAT